MQPPGQVHFWPQGSILNKLDRGLLDDAICLVVSDKKIFNVFLYKPMKKHVIPPEGPFLVPWT